MHNCLSLLLISLVLPFYISAANINLCGNHRELFTVSYYIYHALNHFVAGEQQLAFSWQHKQGNQCKFPHLLLPSPKIGLLLFTF